MKIETTNILTTSLHQGGQPNFTNFILVTHVINKWTFYYTINSQNTKISTFAVCREDFWSINPLPWTTRSPAPPPQHQHYPILFFENNLLQYNVNDNLKLHVWEWNVANHVPLILPLNPPHIPWLLFYFPFQFYLLHTSVILTKQVSKDFLYFIPFQFRTA